MHFFGRTALFQLDLGKESCMHGVHECLWLIFTREYFTGVFMSYGIFSPAALGRGKLRWQDKGKDCCVAKAQDWEPQNPCVSFSSPHLHSCVVLGGKESSALLCFIFYSLSNVRIRATCSVETSQGFLSASKDVWHCWDAGIWSLENIISSTLYNNHTHVSFHSLLWECSNERERYERSSRPGLRYTAQLMRGSGGHRLHTDQAYIVCYFVLDFFSPLFFTMSLLKPQYYWPPSCRFMELSREQEVSLWHGFDWK